jgi:hypothetical protein
MALPNALSWDVDSSECSVYMVEDSGLRVWAYCLGPGQVEDIRSSSYCCT